MQPYVEFQKIRNVDTCKFSIKFSHNLHKKFEGSMEGNMNTNTHTHTEREIYQKVQLVFISSKTRSKEACVGS
jgi:hypothetical protein